MEGCDQGERTFKLFYPSVFGPLGPMNIAKKRLRRLQVIIYKTITSACSSMYTYTLF